MVRQKMNRENPLFEHVKIMQRQNLTDNEASGLGSFLYHKMDEYCKIRISFSQAAGN